MTLLGILFAFSLSQPPAPPVSVVFETELGRIVIEVDVARAKATSANFLRYVDDGSYKGGAFHRTVREDTETRKDVPIEVVQARRGPGTSYPPVDLERTSVTGLKHRAGTVSMARGGVSSATSDFFICLADTPSLDFGGARNADGQGFAAFARVVEGLDVVKKIQAAAVKSKSQTLDPPIAILSATRR